MMTDGTGQIDFFPIGFQPATLVQFVASIAAQGSQIQCPFRSLRKATDSDKLIGMPYDMHAVQRHMFIYIYCQRFFDRDGLELLTRMNLNLINIGKSACKIHTIMYRALNDPWRQTIFIKEDMRLLSTDPMERSSTVDGGAADRSHLGSNFTPIDPNYIFFCSSNMLYQVISSLMGLFSPLPANFTGFPCHGN